MVSDKNWSTVTSYYVLRDRWLTVRADHCVTPLGDTLDPYYVIERPDFVAVLAVDAQDRVILVRQYRHGLRSMSLELPGGILDIEDVDFIVAGRRELAEETGYRGGEFRHIASLGVQPASANNFAHLVVATGVEPSTPCPDYGEDIEVVLLSRDEARKAAMEGGILNAKHVGFLLLGLYHLEIGIKPFNPNT